MYAIFSHDVVSLCEAQPCGNTFNLHLLPIYLMWR